MNSNRQLEYRALTLLEALAAGRKLPDADATAAVFRAWPRPAAKAARLLAAHANAARGRDGLWLIGVGPDGKALGAETGRLAGWLEEVTPLFDGLAPRVTGLKIPLPGTSKKGPPRFAMALQIETGRAPFVIRAGKTSGALEVPWADGDGTVRPAGRLELVKLLVPLQETPQLEMLEADLAFYKNAHPSYANKSTFRWTLDGALYVMPRGEDRLVIPLHRCRASLAGNPEAPFAASGSDLNFTADKNSPSVRLTESAILVEGLGRVFVYASGSTTAPELPLQNSLSFLLDLLPAGAERAATALTTLRPAQVTEGNQAGRWKL